MRRILDTIGGVYQLTRLALLSRCRFGGAYWNWRMHTALGQDQPGRLAVFRAMLEYGVWVHRMRRG